MPGGGAEEVEIGGGAGNVHHAGQGQGLAVVLAFGVGQAVEVGVDEVGDADQQAAPVFGRQGPPGGQGGFGGGHGGGHIVGAGVGNLAVDLAGGGVYVIEVAAGLGRHELAVEVILNAEHDDSAVNSGSRCNINGLPSATNY